MKIKLTDPLFLEANPILKKIESHGYEAYFVGGCVRDTILGKSIHDIDIASSALPEEIEAIFPITIDVGKEHGTIIVVEKHIPYEITTFRTEGDYSDYRHPDNVNFVRDLREDTLRRDFTINAIAFDSDGNLFDYHCGLDDLDQQIIRAVGVPEERFQEDALRIVRAIRFASQLGFKIEEQTFMAVQSNAKLLPQIALERIRIELSKYFQGKYFKQCHQLLVTSNIADNLPLISHFNTKQAMDYMCEQIPNNYQISESMAWYLFCQGLGIEGSKSAKFLKKWTHSNQLIKDVQDFEALEKIIQKNKLTKWEVYLYKLSTITEIEELYHLQHPNYQFQAKSLYDDLVIHERNEILVNGKDIMNWLGLKKGNAALGILISKIEYKIVMEQLPNEINSIKQFVMNNYQE